MTIGSRRVRREFSSLSPTCVVSHSRFLRTTGSCHHQEGRLSTRSTRLSPFTYRDNGHGSQPKELTLGAPEFIRRFSLHILPWGLVRIRALWYLGQQSQKMCSARDLQVPRGRTLVLQPQGADGPITNLFGTLFPMGAQ